MPARPPDRKPEAPSADPQIAEQPSPDGPAMADAAGGATANPLGQLTSFITQVAKSPAAALLGVGLVLIVTGFVRNIGGVHIETTGSQYSILGTALALCTAGVLLPTFAERKRARERAAIHQQLERLAQRELPAIARDPVFLLKVFVDAMPPAFVKELDRDNPAPDLFWSNALIKSQALTARVAQDETLQRIQRDHLAGDRTADDNTESIQVELPNAVVHGKLRPIVTFKRVIEHDGKKYVVGWYVPVEREGVAANAEEICLRQEADQVLFRLAPAKDGDGIKVPIGEAIREALEEQPKPSANRRRTVLAAKKAAPRRAAPRA
jgi:hypothetical protein